ncbi:DUF4041 domain-containing protein [Tessaracoccus caeni]|uniref:DUF4041 domain-containing protein n=1 Tax=Tessaracoccus caeni TaxID=3031239 RepID=UPI0023DA4A5D|nr:DUF4041 domain-containing protein [Tessaracoccus caeni]MDF1486920.1 DUF4041 domain-containing protein [Tessaracoccus caeni]
MGLFGPSKQELERIAFLESQLAERNAWLVQRDALITQRDAQIASLKADGATVMRFLDDHGGRQAWADHSAAQKLAAAKVHAEAELAAVQAQTEQVQQRLAFIQANEFDYENLNRLRADQARFEAQISLLRARAHLEEAGLANYDHPAEDSIALQVELKELRKRISAQIRGFSAVTSKGEVAIPTTMAGQRKFAKDTARLALRAFNAEVENIIAGATANNLDASMTKIFKAAEAIERLGQSSNIAISPAFVELRVRELKLAVDHLKQKAIERELEREHRAELREQARVERELEVERQRLEKEKQHYLNVLKVIQETTQDETEIAKLHEQLVAIEKGINDVEERVANIRAGYVYVISNIGAFGDHMVKIGMTRRLEPMDRVKELGDASVPFGFDVHALFFSEDAVTVEAELHRRFAAQRVNKINLRREFFYATPAEVRDALTEVAGNLLEFREEPEAEQYRLSVAAREAGVPLVDVEMPQRGMLADIGDGLGDEFQNAGGTESA